MSETQVLALHILWTVVFFGLGVFLFVRGDRMTTVKRAFCWTRYSGNAAPDQWEARVQRAIDRRQLAEGSPAPLGRSTGVASLALSAASAFTRVPPSLLYAILCLVIVAVAATAFWKLRNTQQKRVAVLSSRTPDKVISPFWFVLAAVSAFLILPFAEYPQWTLAAIVVCVSSLLTAFIAWRLTMLGAILSGDDIAAEQFVDDRLRSYRVSSVLLLALIQPFVFASQLPDKFGGLEWIVMAFSGIVTAAFALFHLRMQRSDVRLT